MAGTILLYFAIGLIYFLIGTFFAQTILKKRSFFGVIVRIFITLIWPVVVVAQISLLILLYGLFCLIYGNTPRVSTTEKDAN